MARPLRLEFPGAVYHLTARGNERKNVFRSDTDRDYFLSVLRSTVGRFGWLCHGYSERDIAEYIVVHYATVSRALSRMEKLQCKT